uniref:DNA repair protein REV1 n=1 Tax=Kwoniella dejecticola CBS 10117 TaxID=1296121 RepID=A0A1A6A5A9_9TREE|nr:uncharacterized protein I303_04574 [Kwoniella dejecticola CBS 10117]OBR85241.1 hypothetical protein I303_04574 [Kwoniella dejecticola CBS 10117]
MSQHDVTPPPPSTSSTFPLSSPSFWTEAAATVLPSPPSGASKRSRPAFELSSPQSDYTELLEVDVDERKPDLKRGRYDSPSTSNSTTLAYLPKRSDFMAQDDPHGYLANPEYAPNAFGDIGDYMRKKEIKVQTQNRDIALAAAQSNLPQIFKGLSFYINGNTTPPMAELRKMILQRGGEVRPVLRNKGMVKFIIAPMLTQSKFREFKNYKVVKEGWITKSCEENRLLDWRIWKLQIQGGWEEESRKGLEAFMKSQQTPSQLVPVQDDKSDKVEKDDFEPLQANLNGLKETPEGEGGNVASMRRASPIRLSSATQSLLAPYRPPNIPISPQKPPQASETPKREELLAPAPALPANVHKPEGAWEYYYSKDSNEHAAQALKNDQWRLKNTAERGNEGGFIDGYYQNSRLHHLATWKSELKVLVAAAQKRSEELSLSTPSSNSISSLSFANSALPSIRNGNLTAGEKVIFHVDFDCFFVSCGLATRPHLKGKPTVVCHSQAGKTASTSEIASCSYEARAKGVKNGMSLGRARTLVGDDLETIPYEFETYKKYSLAFYTVLMGYADDLQAVSVDEALIDVTSAVNAKAMAPEGASRRPRDPAIEVAEQIRDEVRKLTDGCEVSIGISHNILLAKLATRSAKPAGVAHLVHSDIPAFLAPLDVEDFPSIGYSIKSKIKEKFGSSSVADLLEINKLSFQRVLGPKTGEMLFGYLRGIDERKIEGDKVRKSISAEMNYGIRFKNSDQAEICINDLGYEVAKRMQNLGVKGRQITLKLMKRHPDAPIEPPKFLGHGWCETFNKSSPISGPRGNPTDDGEILARESVKLLKALNLDPVELRGVGIQVTKLDTEDKDKTKDRDPGQGKLSFGSGIKRTTNAKTPIAKAEDLPVNIGQDARRPDESDVVPGDNVPQVQHRVRSQSKSPSTSPRRSRSPSIDDGEAQERSISPQAEAEAEAGPSRLPLPLPLPASPGAEQPGVDPSFLAALPPSLQEEVKRDYQEHQARELERERSVSVAPSVSRAGSERLDSNPPDDRSRERERERVKSTVSPVKGKHAAAHITRQLRPKLKTQLKVHQLSDRPLFSAWNRAQHREGGDECRVDIVDLTASLDQDPDQDQGRGLEREQQREQEREEEIEGYKLSELRELGIDPEVLNALPAEMRLEIVDEERRKVGRRRVLLRPGNGRGSRREMSASASVSPSKFAGSRVRGGSIPPQNGVSSNTNTNTNTYTNAKMMSAKDIARYTINKSLKQKPTLFKSERIEDILVVIERWIESRNCTPPASKDSEKVKNWLIKSLITAGSSSGSGTGSGSGLGAGAGAGLGGVDNVLEMMRFMRMVLREKFPLQEDMVLSSSTPSNTEPETDMDTDAQGPGRNGHADEEEEGDENENRVGKAWWNVWKVYRNELQIKAKELLGAELKI